MLPPSPFHQNFEFLVYIIWFKSSKIRVNMQWNMVSEATVGCYKIWCSIKRPFKAFFALEISANSADGTKYRRRYQMKHIFFCVFLYESGCNFSKKRATKNIKYVHEKPEKYVVQQNNIAQRETLCNEGR